MTTADNALKLAKLKEDDINYLVLIGGSTRIPYIKNMLKNKFKNSELCSSINPDEAVSIGAAIQGAILTQSKDTKIKDINLFDITPLSLGIEVVGEKMNVNIKRNTKIPIEKIKTYQTGKSNLTDMSINIYEGEDKNTKNNHLLGKFKMTGLKKLPDGKAKVEVKFFVDENNILKVSAVDKSNEKNTKEITIINDIAINKEEIKKKFKKYPVINIDYDKQKEEVLLIKKKITELKKEIQNENDIEKKYNNHKLLCENFENLLKIFKENLNIFNNIETNETLFSKYIIYLTLLAQEYSAILSFGNLVEEEVINNIKNKLFTFVFPLTKISQVSVYELLQDLNINRKINNFCCIFKILESYEQGKLLYSKEEINEAGKCFSNILQEASNHDLETQLSFIDQNSGKEIRKCVSDANSYLKKYYIQKAIDEADKLFKKAIINGKIFDLSLLNQSLDSYNHAIQLIKIEKENKENEIIDNEKYDYCINRINEILINIFGKEEDLSKKLKELQKNLELKIDVKKTSKEIIKLILKNYPYNGYNNEYNDKFLDEIFDKEKIEIKKFIKKKLLTKYHPDKVNKEEYDKYLIAQKISSHLNNILDSIRNYNN